MKYLCLTLLIPLLAFSGNEHKYYVSNTIIEHDVLSESMKITIKLFIDDVERALTDSGEHRLYLGEPKELPVAADALRDYILDHFGLKINLRDFPTHYLGREYVNDMIYCYLEIPGIPDFESLEIHTSLLCETFPGQKNVVEVWTGGWNQTEVCDCDRNHVMFRK